MRIEKITKKKNKKITKKTTNAIKRDVGLPKKDKETLKSL